MNSVYMIKFMWSTDDDSGCEIELFNNYDDAVKRFNEMTENEKDPDLSWVADAFEDGKFDDENYELSYYTGTDYMYWSVSKCDDGNFYSTIIRFFQFFHFFTLYVSIHNAELFHARRNGKTNRSAAAFFVCDYKIRSKRIKTAFGTFHRSEKRFHVYAHVGAFSRHCLSDPFYVLYYFNRYALNIHVLYYYVVHIVVFGV